MTEGAQRKKKKHWLSQAIIEEEKITLCSTKLLGPHIMCNGKEGRRSVYMQ